MNNTPDNNTNIPAGNNKRSSPLLKVLPIAVLAAVLVYFAAQVYNYFADPMTITLVYEAQAEDVISMEGWLVRTEEPLTVPAGIADGARVPAGADGFARPAVCFLQADGYEYLTPDMLDGLTVESLRDILAAEPEKSLSGGRAVYGFAWYFAALADDGAPLREGGSCEILFDGFEKSTAAEIISVSAAENGQRALLLRLTASSPEYLSLRRSGAEIIFSRYSGLELPLEAVHTDGERNNFVYISTAGIVRSLDVDIIYTDKAGGFCLAAQDASFDALREGNTVIVSGKDIYEGKVLG